MRYSVLMILIFCAVAIGVLRDADAPLPSSIAAVPSGEAAADPQLVVETLVAGPSRLTTTFAEDMPPAMLDAYRDWSRRPSHFGAFAMSPFGAYGHTRSYNTAQAADAAAIALCDQAECRVIARISAMVRNPGEGVLVVSRPTEATFQEYLALPGAKAMAIHPNGARGSWVGAPSIGAATAGAIRECRNWYETAPSPTEVGRCRVVHMAPTGP